MHRGRDTVDRTNWLNSFRCDRMVVAVVNCTGRRETNVLTEELKFGLYIPIYRHGISSLTSSWYREFEFDPCHPLLLFRAAFRYVTPWWYHFSLAKFLFRLSFLSSPCPTLSLSLTLSIFSMRFAKTYVYDSCIISSRKRKQRFAHLKKKSQHTLSIQRRELALASSHLLGCSASICKIKGHRNRLISLKDGFQEKTKHIIYTERARIRAMRALVRMSGIVVAPLEIDQTEMERRIMFTAAEWKTKPDHIHLLDGLLVHFLHISCFFSYSSLFMQLQSRAIASSFMFSGLFFLSFHVICVAFGVLSLFFLLYYSLCFSSHVAVAFLSLSSCSRFWCIMLYLERFSFRRWLGLGLHGSLSSSFISISVIVFPNRLKFKSVFWPEKRAETQWNVWNVLEISGNNQIVIKFSAGHSSVECNSHLTVVCCSNDVRRVIVVVVVVVSVLLLPLSSLPLQPLPLLWPMRMLFYC